MPGFVYFVVPKEQQYEQANLSSKKVPNNPGCRARY